MARKRTGSIPIPSSAEISLEIFMFPINAASAAPDLPITTSDVKKGPNSLMTTMMRIFPKYSPTPNFGMVVVAWMMIVIPQSRPMMPTSENASTPVKRI